MASTTLAFDIIARDRASEKFDKVGSSVGGMSSKLKTFAAVGGAALAAAGVAAGKFAIDAIGAASDLNETMSKSSVIFGKNAGEVQKWAGNAARTMGLSKQAALEAASGFGDMFTQIGFSGDQATNMSKKVVQMSADLGSFNNLETADVAERMSAAFRGEFDSLQALVPNINAARVETEALAMTGKKSAKELTAQEKAAATLAIVQKDGARAAGDFARTSDGLANQQKILSAQFENTKAKIGTALLPVATKFVQFLNNGFGPAAQKAGAFFKEHILPPMKDFGEKIAPKVRDLMDKVKGAFKDAQPWFELAGKVFKNVVGPALTWVASVVLTHLARRMEMLGKAVGVAGKAGIWLWNNAFAPTIRFLLRGFAMVTEGWAIVLRGLSKVPGFGWARKAADSMENAARKARGLAESVNAIPSNKHVNITVGVSGQQALNTLLRLNRGGAGSSAPAGPVIGHAAGTSYWRGGPTRVHEQGPEIIDLPGGTRIIPAGLSRQMAGGADEAALYRALRRALSELPILRLPDSGQGAYLRGGF